MLDAAVLQSRIRMMTAVLTIRDHRQKAFDAWNTPRVSSDLAASGPSLTAFYCGSTLI